MKDFYKQHTKEVKFAIIIALALTILVILALLSSSSITNYSFANATKKPVSWVLSADNGDKDYQLKEIYLPETYNALDPELPANSELKRVSEGIFEFKQEEMCTTDAWKNNEVCKFFIRNFQMPIGETEAKKSIMMSYHIAESTAKGQEFENFYLGNVKKNIEKNKQCTGGVLRNEDRTEYLNVVGTQDIASKVYEILNYYQTQLNFEKVYRCDQPL